MQRCYKCSAPWAEAHPVGFQDVCDSCGSYLHCCLNCRFYDEYAHNHCAEPTAEYISDPNGMNRCEYFVFKESAGGRLFNDSDDTKPKRRRAPDWRNVRKEGGSKSPGRGPGRRKPEPQGAGGAERAQQARRKLEDLFRDKD